MGMLTLDIQMAVTTDVILNTRKQNKHARYGSIILSPELVIRVSKWQCLAATFHLRIPATSCVTRC